MTKLVDYYESSPTFSGRAVKTFEVTVYQNVTSGRGRRRMYFSPGPSQGTPVLIQVMGRKRRESFSVDLVRRVGRCSLLLPVEQKRLCEAITGVVRQQIEPYVLKTAIASRLLDLTWL